MLKKVICIKTMMYNKDLCDFRKGTEYDAEIFEDNGMNINANDGYPYYFKDGQWQKIFKLI